MWWVVTVAQRRARSLGGRFTEIRPSGLGRHGVLAVTDFPDIRLKAAIQSANDGSVLIIPGKAVSVRIYGRARQPRETNGSRAGTSPFDYVIAAAQRILHPTP